MAIAVCHSALIESVAHVTVTLLLEQLVTAARLRYKAVGRRTALVLQAASAVLTKTIVLCHHFKT